MDATPVLYFQARVYESPAERCSSISSSVKIPPSRISRITKGGPYMLFDAQHGQSPRSARRILIARRGRCDGSMLGRKACFRCARQFLLQTRHQSAILHVAIVVAR